MQPDPIRATRPRATRALLSARAGLALTITLSLAGALPACGSGSVDAPATGTTTSATAAGTADVKCAYDISVFNASPSVKATSMSKWSCTGTQRILAANGVPDHSVGTFPNPDNPNTISAQTVSASLPLAPSLTGILTTLGGPRGATGYVLNGVKIDAGTNGGCNDAGTVCDPGNPAGQWRMEALGQSSFKFGTDSNNAHVQPDGAYHYHGMPEGFVANQGQGLAMTLIGWAADGFPIYARYGYSLATDATSAIKVVAGSYRLKATPDANRPSTSLYPLGAFMQDYEYVAGLGDLDECNGRTGVTPEFPGGTYHYFATDTYPFLQRCVKGRL